jgi:NADH dehydrogenase/NADH:ubiquinone oxidoreductase subunit G
MSARPLLHRVVARNAPRVTIMIDGVAVEADAGESLLVAILAQGAQLRLHEVDGTPRAGFCLMGACQDCWVSQLDGQRLRACTTPVVAGMVVFTRPPGVRANA